MQPLTSCSNLYLLLTPFDALDIVFGIAFQSRRELSVYPITLNSSSFLRLERRSERIMIRIYCFVIQRFVRPQPHLESRAMFTNRFRSFASPRARLDHTQRVELLKPFRSERDRLSAHTPVTQAIIAQRSDETFVDGEEPHEERQNVPEVVE